MKKFLVIYHAPADAQMETSNRSQEEQAKGMEPWMEWAKKCGDKLVDLGSPLANGIKFYIRMEQKQAARQHLETAMELTRSEAERKILKHKLETLG